MTQSDAAKILAITGELTSEIIKQAYKKACIKYHPDKGGSLEMMKAVNQAYEALKDYEGTVTVDAGDMSYPDDLNDAINAVVNLDGLDVEICGAWVWVTGDTKTHKEALKGAAYRWANKKSAWYFRPSDWKSKNRGNWSLDRIRDEHGSQKVKKSQQNKIAA